MFGRVARMSRLDCVRESLRLALQELEGATPPEARPVFWVGLWERYVESQADYRVSAETLGRKLVEAGADACQLLEWLRRPGQSEWAVGPQAQLLARVFGEQFEVLAGQPAPPVPGERGGGGGRHAHGLRGPRGVWPTPSSSIQPTAVRSGWARGQFQSAARVGRTKDPAQGQGATEFGSGAKPA